VLANTRAVEAECGGVGVGVGGFEMMYLEILVRMTSPEYRTTRLALFAAQRG
jgi:hypothetical protein